MDQSSEKLRLVLAKLDNVADTSPLLEEEIVIDARETIRRHLADNQTIIRDLQDKLRRNQEDTELQIQRGDDLQELLEQRDAAYEDLLSECLLEMREDLPQLNSLSLQPNKRLISSASMRSK